MSDKSIKCDYCNAELPLGLKFCTECGKPLKQNPNFEEEDSNQKNNCPNCNAKIASDLRFCTECGTEIGQHSNNQKTCPHCHAKIASDLRFCTECGKPLKQNPNFEEVDSNQKNNCPHCHAKISPDLRFCTECGASLEDKIKTTNEDKIKTSNENINQELRKRREQFKTANSDEDPLNTISGVLNKAASSLENNLNKLGESANNISKPSNNSRIMKPKKKIDNNGYLICDKCNGYYELKQGEAPDDFSDECECGGKLKHQKSLPN